jgi:hypothetical protein
MKDVDFLQQYMDAVKEASNRTRQILLVMIVASILVFAAFWNTRQDGWVNSRLRDATLAVEKLGDAKTTDATAAPVLYKLQWIQKIRAEQVSQIQVPVIGISFDVNDLGMLGGFAFIVFLIWVNYSVWHLSTNLRLALEFAKNLDEQEPTQLLYYTYQNLAMRQVLTIPPKPASIRTSEGKFKSLLQKASKLLYALPFIVQTIVVWHDWITTDIGNRYNSNATRIVLIMEIAFWCLNGILTIICFYIWRKTYETWKIFADKI